jgi:hypothetical protein
MHRVVYLKKTVKTKLSTEQETFRGPENDADSPPDKVPHLRLTKVEIRSTKKWVRVVHYCS